MKRLFVAGVAVSLLVAVASISGAGPTVNSSKSNSSERVAGKEGGQQKKAKSTPAAGAQGQQDPCASVKNDPQQYAKCQDAATPSGLSRRSRSKHGGKAY